MSIETELKLAILPENVEKLIQHPLLHKAAHSKPAQRLYSTYFDTPNHALLQQGIGCRIRRVGKKRIQTLKTAGFGLGGLHQRQEWETNVESDVPNLEVIPEGVLPNRIISRFHQIEPLFITDFQRTIWYVTEGENQVEVALDQGHIKTQTSSTDLSEVELELKSGDPHILYQIALELQKTIPLTIENHSKAARGYALHTPYSPVYHKAPPVELIASMTVEASLSTILWHCIGHLNANEDMVLHGDDIEGVHQMRVALRRLRSCLSLYKEVLPEMRNSELWQELKWISAVLGIARDWDVFNLSLQEMQTQTFGQAVLEDLQVIVMNARISAYHLTREAIRSPRYSRLLLLLGEWITGRGWRQNLDNSIITQLEQPVIGFANRILQTQYAYVCKRGKQLHQLDATKLHEFRIAIKKIGYGSRFFSDLYPAKDVKRYVKKLVQLQDELGILNDASVATRLLNEAKIDDNAATRHFLNGWYAHQHIVHLKILVEAWQNLLEQKVFWK